VTTKYQKSQTKAQKQFNATLKQSRVQVSK